MSWEFWGLLALVIIFEAVGTLYQREQDARAEQRLLRVENERRRLVAALLAKDEEIAASVTYQAMLHDADTKSDVEVQEDMTASVMDLDPDLDVYAGETLPGL